MIAHMMHRLTHTDTHQAGRDSRNRQLSKRTRKVSREGLGIALASTVLHCERSLRAPLIYLHVIRTCESSPAKSQNPWLHHLFHTLAGFYVEIKITMVPKVVRLIQTPTDERGKSKCLGCPGNVAFTERQTCRGRD